MARKVKPGNDMRMGAGYEKAKPMAAPKVAKSKAPAKRKMK